MPRPYARTLMILLRDRYSVRELSQRTGMDVRVLYLLARGDATTWTLAIQSLLESLVPAELQGVLERLREAKKSPDA
jgi:hypothetical protein